MLENLSWRWLRTTTKRKNLETPATSKLKGLVAHYENDQKVEAVVQRTYAGEDGPILPPSHFPTSSSHAHRVEMTGDISMASLADSLGATASSGPLTPPSIDNTSASAPLTPFWYNAWSKPPGLLPACETKKKLRVICGSYVA